jgi:hypothetical protein
MSGADEAQFQAAIGIFCDRILQVDSTLDFRVSSRGWAYILEQRGIITKGLFDKAQDLINQCRKDGRLPLGICAEDENRQAGHLEYLDDDNPEDHAKLLASGIRNSHEHYTPFSFWRDLPIYVEMAVEKIDLKSLFSPICAYFHVPLTNWRGWSDINSRAAMMRRFAEKEEQGKRCVLLYRGDHDPAGLAISDFLRRNMTDLADAVGWDPEHLIVDRFGLNADFIEAQRLTWIDNLETGSGRPLDDPRHPDHCKAYVQDYLAQFGARKCEANALVVRPQAGRDLCRRAILRYVPADAVDAYEALLRPERENLRKALADLLKGWSR